MNNSNAVSPPESHQAKIPLRVLVVDDNSDAADLIGILLNLSGYESHAVHNGKAALEAVITFRPNVVLLGLPGVNGCEVAKKIRENPALDKIVLIAFAGDGQLACAVGFTHFFLKPVKFVVIKQILDSIKS